MSLQDVTIVITGSARGIGAATAELAAARGANVVVSDIIDDAGEATVADLPELVTIITQCSTIAAGTLSLTWPIFFMNWLCSVSR